ncbi:DUF4381 domain-containing protein [Rhizobium nepotum]|uniref:DUF4381 domain-containing protein n=1 Tax=Rhizobium nepotum TaxID=1035271 RepID=UPI00336AD3BD
MDSTVKLDPMTEAALRTMRDIAMPPQVSWIPQTWGWSVLAGALLIMLAVIGTRWILRYRANAYRREAVALVNVIEERLRDPAARREGLRDIAEILKRTALAAWPRSEVASLSGNAWIRFLEEHDDDGRMLQRLVDDFEYRGAGLDADLPSDVCSELVVAARNWIERHHVSA